MSCDGFCHVCTGNKRSGPRAIRYRCSTNGKSLAKEVKKMHDDFHYIAFGYCNNRSPLHFETMEKIIIKKNDREDNTSSYPPCARCTFFFCSTHKYSL